VRLKSYDKIVKKILNDNIYGIGIQRPQAMHDVMKIFYDIIKHEEGLGRTIRIKGLKLFCE
jgi:hypothetical protein